MYPLSICSAVKAEKRQEKTEKERGGGGVVGC